MNTWATRNKLTGFRLKPGWRTFYRLGVEYNAKLPAHNTWGVVARYLGCSKQNAYTAGMLALGKLIYFLRQRVDGSK
jgi:hypothetical protein